MIKKYAFSLESVLNYRKVIEEQRERTFSLALQALYREEEKLRSIENTIENKRKELFYLESQSVTGEVLLSYERYFAYLDERKINQRTIINFKKKELEEKRQELIESTKDRKLIDRLREKDLRRYMDFVNHREQVYLDEIATTRFLGRKREQEGDI